jgi:chaperonin GroEL (HSP60 family)
MRVKAQPLSFGDGAGEKSCRGVDLLAAAVKLGLGPPGRSVVCAASEAAGVVPARASPDDRDRARRIELDKHRRNLISGAFVAKPIAVGIATIRTGRTAATSNQDRQMLDERAARLSSGVAPNDSRAAPQTEPKERTLRSEGALHAARAAFEEGMLPGGAAVPAAHGLPMPGAAMPEY